MRLVLASGSPRRRELLAALGFDFQVAPSGVDEEAMARSRPEALARALARAKALEVFASHPDAVVLAADTVVVQRGVLLAKPADAAEARAMLARLRGRPHRVITAVCVIAPGARPRLAHEVTRVVLRTYSQAEVEASIARGDPFDKAGGYAIQDSILQPVASHRGCYCNVVGLPLWTALGLLEEAGVRRSHRATMPLACDACATKPQ
jgi:septum formation protein